MNEITKFSNLIKISYFSYGSNHYIKYILSIKYFNFDEININNNILYIYFSLKFNWSITNYIFCNFKQGNI